VRNFLRFTSNQLCHLSGILASVHNDGADSHREPAVELSLLPAWDDEQHPLCLAQFIADVARISGEFDCEAVLS
jgi:hypothetical protein